MIRKFKTLGVAFVAVLAMSAVVASAAQATNFTASGYPTSFTAESGKGNDTFKTEAGTVECKSHFSGTLSAASENVDITPSYSGCTAFGFLNAEVTVPAACKYRLNVSGSISLVAVGGSCAGITIHAGTCRILMTPQSGLKEVHISNVASGINIQATVKKISYHVEQDGFGCPFNGTGEKTNAEYIQHAPITAVSKSGTTIDVG
jgi:hypothetical protein